MLVRAYPMLAAVATHTCTCVGNRHACTLSQQINWTWWKRTHLQLNLCGYVKQSKHQ